MKARMLLLWTVLGICGQASAQTIDGAPYIAVHGEARREVAPDIFPLALSLSETSTDTAKTQAKIEALASKILELADRTGITEGDLTVANLTISPEYDYDDEAGKQVFLGNTYERDITLRFHSLDGMRGFIAALPDDKALKVDTKNFETSRATELRHQLLQTAIDNARGTAESLAVGIGRKLGAVHTISNRGFNVSYSENAATTLGRVAVSGSKALLAPGIVALKEGRITLDQHVYIVYALE